MPRTVGTLLPAADAEMAGQGLHGRRFQRLCLVHRRQDTGKARGQHSFPAPGGPARRILCPIKPDMPLGLIGYIIKILWPIRPLLITQPVQTAMEGALALRKHILTLEREAEG